MEETTFIIHHEDMKRDILKECHGGKGDLDWTIVLDAKDIRKHNMKILWFHDDILPVGTSIGIHRHESDEELYYFLSGKGTMTLDGKRQEVMAGDVSVVVPGGEHGLENTGNEDLRFIVVGI
jgi:mannose-6-phosphate isomerase-like protein (cupin superfamily)